MLSLIEFKHFYSDYISDLNDGEILFVYNSFKYSPRNFSIINVVKELLRLRKVKVPSDFITEYAN